MSRETSSMFLARLIGSIVLFALGSCYVVTREAKFNTRPPRSPCGDRKAGLQLFCRPDGLP